MQTCVKLAVEIAAFPSVSSNHKYTFVYVPMCCGFVVMGDSCRVVCSNFEAPDDDHIGRNM
jgi:hypothetical protein